VIVSDFQSVLGREDGDKIRAATKHAARSDVAGGRRLRKPSASSPAFRERQVRIGGVEAGGAETTGGFTRRFMDKGAGGVGVRHGTRTYRCRTRGGSPADPFRFGRASQRRWCPSMRCSRRRTCESRRQRREALRGRWSPERREGIHPGRSSRRIGWRVVISDGGVDAGLTVLVNLFRPGRQGDLGYGKRWRSDATWNTRIAARFEEAKREGKKNDKGFVAFVPPETPRSISQGGAGARDGQGWLSTCSSWGCPLSDTLDDGPVIQSSSHAPSSAASLLKTLLAVVRPDPEDETRCRSYSSARLLQSVPALWPQADGQERRAERPALW